MRRNHRRSYMKPEKVTRDSIKPSTPSRAPFELFPRERTSIPSSFSLFLLALHKLIPPPFFRGVTGVSWSSVLVFFINPIGASGIDPGRRPGANPSTTPFFERGFHLNFSRWFYRTPPTLIGRLQQSPQLASLDLRMIRSPPLISVSLSRVYY